MTEMREIQIQFGDIVMTLPKSIEAISTARDLLDMLEESIVSKWVCKHCGCTENTPCPGGCFWVAPNLCSRCAAENTPEVPEPETLRNVSVPARESAITTEKNIKCPDNLKGIARREVIDDSPLTFFPADYCKFKKNTAPPAGIMHPSDLKLPAFEYDKNKMQQYKTIFFQELSDGRVALDYCDSHYYATKDAVLQIPYPFPQNYFSKENGWSSSVEQAFKKYRMYLAEQEQQQKVETKKKEQQPQKEKPEDPDDWKYRPFNINNTKVGKEDYGKVEGTLEA